MTSVDFGAELSGIRCWNKVRARNKAITRGWPNFNAGAFSPTSVTVGCTTLWMLSPLKPLIGVDASNDREHISRMSDDATAVKSR